MKFFLLALLLAPSLAQAAISIVCRHADLPGGPVAFTVQETPSETPPPDQRDRAFLLNGERAPGFLTAEGIITHVGRTNIYSWANPASLRGFELLEVKDFTAEPTFSGTWSDGRAGFAVYCDYGSAPLREAQGRQARKSDPFQSQCCTRTCGGNSRDSGVICRPASADTACNPGPRQCKV